MIVYEKDWHAILRSLAVKHGELCALGVTRMPPIICHPAIKQLAGANDMVDSIGEVYIMGFHVLTDDTLPLNRIELGAWWARS